MILAGTGHRCAKIRHKGVNAYDARVYNRLVRLCKAALTHYAPKYIISGMALGFDQALAEACIELEIPFIAAIPFSGQADAWPQASRDKYNMILKKASKRHTVCEGFYKPYKMQLRNEWMTDQCTHVLALWNGSQGGTYNCIRYAEKTGKPVLNLWDKWKPVEEMTNGMD